MRVNAPTQDSNSPGSEAGNSFDKAVRDSKQQNSAEQPPYQQAFYEENRDHIETIREKWDDWNGKDSIVSDKDLRKFAADDNRSAEERDAAQFLLDNKGFFDHLDTKAHDNKADGKISNNDLNAWLRPVAFKAEDTGVYKDFLKANPDADEASKEIAKNGALLSENFDIISKSTDSGKHLTREALQKYLDENTGISDDLKQAITFWLQPGAFSVLETGKNPLKEGPDGKLSKDDINNSVKTHNPKTASDAILFLNKVANNNATSSVDTSKLGKDVFDNPQNYTVEERAAVLQDLLKAQQLIIDGSGAGMWSDDYGKVAIANRVQGHPDPDKLLGDVNDHIAQLQGDPEVVEFLNESTAKQMSTLFEDNPALKDAVQKSYEDSLSGAALDKIWETHTKDGKTDQTAALSEFFSTAKLQQEALGIDDLGEIQKALGDSSHASELKDYYKDSLASGTRLEELMKTGTYEEAVATYSGEVALYNAALDPEFTAEFDTQLSDNFSKVAKDNAMKDGSFDDLKAALGVDGGEELDEEKVKKMIEEVIKTNPELLTNPDGTVATADQVLAGVRGSWDVLRQGTKSLAELKSDWLSPDLKDMSDRGVLHGISGIFMSGVTIAKGAQSGGKLTERAIVDITTGSVMSATLLTEGGTKNLKTYVKDAGAKLTDQQKQFFTNPAKSVTDTLSTLEDGAKGVGGLAGIVAGAYGIFDGVQSIRKGDTVAGGFSITSGSIGALAGLSSAAEGAAGVLGRTAIRAALAPISGILGMTAGVVAGFALMLPGLIEEGKKQTRQDQFGDLLSDYLTQYEIDGVPNGDIYDIPDEEWPDSE